MKIEILTQKCLSIGFNTNGLMSVNKKLADLIQVIGQSVNADDVDSEAELKMPPLTSVIGDKPISIAISTFLKVYFCLLIMKSNTAVRCIPQSHSELPHRWCFPYS